jgi:hypothetical protein
VTTTTTPDGIIRWTTSDAMSFVGMSTSISNSLQTAFNKRERYDYVWKDDTARQDQTGMVQGSRGYQVDNETEWIFDNSAWGLTKAHTEYTYTGENVDSGVVTGVGTLSVDSSQSTNTSQTTTTTIGGTGQIIFANPGVYAYHATAIVGGPGGTEGQIFLNRTFIELNVGGSNVVARTNAITNETIVGLAVANLRIVNANQATFTNVYQTTGVDLVFEGRIRITRLT